MSDLTPASSSLYSKHRLEALSDGVFAVVMTLLVLELKPELPQHSDNETVARVLHELARPLAGYAFAFAITGVFWVLHHRNFTLLVHTNGPHTALTLAFLFAVTLLPLSVSIFLKARFSSLGQAVYFGNTAFIALTLLTSWLYANRAGLADSTMLPQAAAALTRRMAAMGALGLIACAATWLGQQWLLLLAMPVILWVRFRRAPASPIEPTDP
jgi:uncharacterized membrane protein